MIQANIVALEQSIDFEQDKFNIYLVLDINGKRLRTIIEDGVDVTTLVKDLQAKTAEVEPADVPAQPESKLVVDEEPVEPELVQWADLPDNVLNPRLKKALAYLNVASSIEASKLTGLLDQILDKFGPEEWEAIGAPLAPAKLVETPTQGLQPPAPRPPPAAPAVGAVTWTDGTPIIQGEGARARTVPADDYGYPIVANGDRDLGEVLGRGGDDVDESGVSQM